jgi:hypothetical protein
MPPPAGLCDTCSHQKVIRNTRGSSFSLCLRAREDARFAKYPPLPVRHCPGHEPCRAAGGAEPPR